VDPERLMIVEQCGLESRAKESGTKSGKAFGRPPSGPDTKQRIREALATPAARLPQDRCAVRRRDRHGSAEREGMKLSGVTSIQRHMTRATTTEAIKPSQSRGPPSLRRA
jgi:hypothetical protein